MSNAASSVILCIISMPPAVRIVNLFQDVTVVTYTRSPAIRITGHNGYLQPVILRGFQVP